MNFATNHQKNLRQGRVTLPDQIYSITKCQDKTQNPMLTETQGLPHCLVNIFFFCHKKRWLSLHAFVVMPNHYHLLFCLNRAKKLEEVLHSINSFSSKEITKNFGFRSPVWQEGFFDHAIRHQESLERHINYIQENPLRAGLVEDVKSWPIRLVDNL